MPSRAVYTALAFVRSDTGCSTVLIPWVEEPVMVAPEVVGGWDCRVISPGGPASQRAGQHDHQRVPGARPVQPGDTSVLRLLVEPHLVARRVPERAVPNPVRLVHRLLEHLGPARRDLLKQRVHVAGLEHE